MKTQTAQKVLNVIKTVIVSIIVAIAVFMMIFTIVSVTMFDENERNIFGYKFYIVQSDSMRDIRTVDEEGNVIIKSGYFDIYDVIISKEVTDFSSLKEGDIITFMCGDMNNKDYGGKIITHMIRDKVTDGEYPTFQTYGTSTGSDDPFIVESSWILGEYQLMIPFAGPLFRFLKQPVGYVVCILIPFLLLILSQGINFVRLFRQYKKEQMAEMEAERAKIEEERQAAQKDLAEAQRMMAELLAMKDMLAKQAAGAGASADQPVAEPAEPVAEPAEPVVEATEVVAEATEVVAEPVEAEEAKAEANEEVGAEAPAEEENQTEGSENI